MNKNILSQWVLGGSLAVLLSACATQQATVAPAAQKTEKPKFQQAVTAYNAHNYSKALDIWVDLADQGDAEALNALGLMYQSGKGVARDVGVAARLYQQAAAAGLPSAQNNLAVMYESGEGVPQDVEKAVDLYRKSASAGYVWAEYNLGRVHATGVGVAKDNAAAAEYFKQANESKARLSDTDLQPNR